jgi:predicted MPP superfamily phosphohydrolase
MKKIIHLSDLHVGHEDCGEKFLKIIDNITLQMQPAGDYIILITGDIVDNANHPGFVEEAMAGIRQLEQRGYCVLVVPGNHDYGTGAWGNEEFVAIFKEKYYGNREITYPKLDITDDVAFIGLDSTAEELHWYDAIFSQGELGNSQLKRLKKILQLPEISPLKKVVYLHHHPFDFKLGMKLKDKEKLKKIIGKKVDALLFGHYHASAKSAGKIYHGRWGINRCYNAGSSTHKNGNNGYHRVIDLSNPDPRVDYDGCFL